MSTSDTVRIIKESFEDWYNSHVATDSPVSILINYKDEQRLSMRAFHTVTYEVQSIGIEGDTMIITPLILLSENYNHGTTTEQEAKDNLTKKLLERLYSYKA